MRTSNDKKDSKVARTTIYNRGGVFVGIDFDKNRNVLGVEVLDAKSVHINGKKVKYEIVG